jgi:hypothetical protein
VWRLVFSQKTITIAIEWLEMSRKSIELRSRHHPLSVAIKALNKAGPLPSARRVFIAAPRRCLRRFNFGAGGSRFCHAASDTSDEIVDSDHVALWAASVWKPRWVT